MAEKTLTVKLRRNLPVPNRGVGTKGSKLARGSIQKLSQALLATLREGYDYDVVRDSKHVGEGQRAKEEAAAAADGANRFSMRKGGTHAKSKKAKAAPKAKAKAKRKAKAKAKRKRK